jgi:hypothetical protein
MKKTIFIYKILLFVFVCFWNFLPCLVAQNDVVPFITSATSTNTSDGSISLQINGGYAPFTFVWSGSNGFGETTQNISNLKVGQYCVTVTDTYCAQANLCISVGTCAIATTAQLTHPVGNVPTGTIALNVTGASEPMTYTWSNGQNTKTISNLTPGSYCVTINDAYGCRDTKCFTILNCPVITVTPNVIPHPSSDCGATDGWIKILGQSATGGVAPYTFMWLNPDGTRNTQTTSSLYNLVSGNYCLVATDSRGCQGRTCVFLGAKHEPLVYADIAPACTVQNNGSIVVTAIDQEDFSNTYDFEWSNGIVKENDIFSENFSLYSGTYVVTITSNSGACVVVKEFVVPQVVPTSDLAATTIVKHNCPNEYNGSIQVNATGGIEPYSYKWSTNPNTLALPIKNNLGAGNYSVTVTDYCGTQVVRQVTLRPIDIIGTNAKAGCRNDGYASVSVANGNPGYIYNWSNGTNGDAASGLASGVYTVTVTDVEGCSAIKEVIVQNKEYTFEQKGSCEALSNGTVDFTIHNPNNGPVSLLFNGETLLNSLTTNDVVKINKQGLPSDYVFSFQLNIDGCKYEMNNLKVGTYKTTREFSSFTQIGKDDIVCTDNVLCDGVPVDGAIVNYNPRLNFADATTWNCSVPIFCGSHDTGQRKHFAKKWLRVIEYKQMLVDVINNPGPDPIIGYDKYEILYYTADNLYLSCDLVRYCPATLEITAHLTTLQPLIPLSYNQETNCYLYSCISIPLAPFFPPKISFDICPGFEAPPISTQVIATFNSLPELCTPASYSLYQLIVWTPYFLANPNLFPNFGTSILYTDHIIPHMSDLKARCVNITFCTKGQRMFEILNTPDYDAVSCDDINVNIDCQSFIHPEVNGGHETVYCIDPYSDQEVNLVEYDPVTGYTSEPYPVSGWSYLIQPNFPGHFFTGSNEDNFRNKTKERISNNIQGKANLSYLVAPNPFQNYFDLQIKSESDGIHLINITDVNGISVKKEEYLIHKGNQKIEINVNNDLPAGLYFLKISDKNLNSKTFKLIKI